jgi:hypothetical protein
MPRKPTPTDTDSEGGETDVAAQADSLTDEPDTVPVAQAAEPREPSPLDMALRSTRARSPAEVDLWLAQRDMVQVVPMAFMPGNLTDAPLYNADTDAALLEPAVQALQAMQQATQALLDVRAAARSDPTLTQAAAILATADAADRLLPKATQRIDTAAKNLDAQVKHAEAALQAPVTQGATGAFAAELRSVVRAMDPGQRMTALTNAIRDGDAALAGAVLGAHPLLSGFDAKGIQALTAAWQRARQPDLVRRVELLRYAEGALDRAGRAYLNNIEGLQGAKVSTVANLRAQTGKAKAVLGAVFA